MPDVLTILSSLVASGLLSAGLIWLTKNWISERLKNSIKHEYDEKLETHKAQLKSQTEIEIEQLKSQLQIAAAERNIRYTKIFERTAEATAETYSKLLALLGAFEHYTMAWENENTPPKAERRQVVSKRLEEFFGYYRPNRLFLPKDTVIKIEEFVKKLHGMTVEFMIGVEQGMDSHKNDPDRNTWMKTMDFMTKEVPPLLTILEDDFRKILGTLQDSTKN